MLSSEDSNFALTHKTQMCDPDVQTKTRCILTEEVSEEDTQLSCKCLSKGVHYILYYHILLKQISCRFLLTYEDSTLYSEFLLSYEDSTLYSDNPSPSVK